MKKLLLLLIFPFFFVSCNNHYQDKITGKWMIIEFNDSDSPSISKDNQQMYDESIKELKTNSYFDFQPNGQYEIQLIVLGKTTIDKGVWEIDYSGTQLFLTSQTEGSEQVLELGDLEEKSCKLIAKNPKRTIEFKLQKIIPWNSFFSFSSLYF